MLLSKLYSLHFCLILFLFVQFQPLSAQTKDSKQQSIKDLRKLAQEASKKDDYPRIVELSKVIAERAKEQNWKWMELIAFINMADAVEEMAEYEKADSVFSLVFTVLQDTLAESPNDFLYALTHRQYGRYLSRTRQLDEAEEALEKSIQILKQLGKKDRRYAGVVHDLGTVYSKKQRHTEAIFYLTEAKDLRKELLGEEHRRYGTSLNNLAIAYDEKGDRVKAENYYRKALAVRKAALGADSHRYLLTRSNFGYFFMDLGDYEEAFEWIAPVTEQMKGRPGDFQRYYQGLLSSRGYLHFKLGRPEAAKRDLLESKQLGFELYDFPNEGMMIPMTGLAQLYQDQQQWEKAEAELLQALRINLEDSTVLNSLALEELKKLPQADIRYINVMLRQLKQLGELYEDWSAQRPKLKNKAYAVYRIALQVSEQLRNEMGETGDKLELLANNADLVDDAISLQLDWHAEPHEDWKELFTLIEQNKSILLADAMKTQRAQDLIPSELVTKERRLQKAIDEQDKKINEGTNSKEQAEARTQRNDLKLRLKELRQEIEEKFPRYHQLKYANITATVQGVQDLLPSKTAFLEYFVGEKQSYLFWVEKDYFHIYPIAISRDSLGKQVKRLRKTLSDYIYIRSEPEASGKQYRNTAHWFYQALVEPALSQRDKLKRLIIVTDGELGHLPFETFLTEAVGMEQDYTALPYLLKDFRISYNYSATLFKENAAEAERAGNHKLLAMAATYNGDDAEAAEVRSMYYRSLRNVLQPLPEAQQEVKALSGNFEGKGLLGKQATEREFKATAKDYSLLHLAMHSLANKEQPSLSSLVFTEDGDTLEDNFLQAYEIARLDLKAQLVVLSACETGFGKFQQGEGVMSLARSFMYAGVPSVVVSLWQVSDESTSVIMQDFYQELFAGHRKDDALRQAKLRYLEKAEGVAAHPAFWAAFIQVGDARPIDLAGQRMTWWSIGALALGGLLVLGLGARILRRRKAE